MNKNNVVTIKRNAETVDLVLGQFIEKNKNLRSIKNTMIVHKDDFNFNHFSSGNIAEYIVSVKKG